MNRKWLGIVLVLAVLIPLGLSLAASDSLRRTLAGTVRDYVTLGETKEAAEDQPESDRRRREAQRYREARRQALERGESPEFAKTRSAKSAKSGSSRVTWVLDGEKRLYPTPYERLEGISRPPILTAIDLTDGKRIKDGDMILGVTIGGRARAYLLEAFFESGYEIVNDNIGGYLMTVSYDHRNERGRALVPPEQGEPLPPDRYIDVYLGGHDEDTLLVGFDNRVYWHDSPDVPLKDHPFVITSWYTWQLLHPLTEAYIGPELVE